MTEPNEYMRDFRPRYIRHDPPSSDPCAMDGCVEPSVDFGESFIAGALQVEGRTIAPIHTRLRYCEKHLAE